MTTLPEPPPTLLNITDLVSGPISPRVSNPTWPNAFHTRIAEVVASKGPPPWSVRLIADERNLVTLIANPPNSGNRPHWHKDFDEWWVIFAGRLRWEFTGGTVIEAQKDELVWVPRGTVHHISNVGDEMSLRMAIAMPPAVHYYSPCEQCGYADDGPRAFWVA
jgi:mannose-6-phosphate isomerase-like protein (cupin superfamily)